MKINNLYWIINTRNDKEPLSPTWPQIQTGLEIGLEDSFKGSVDLIHSGT